MRQKENRVIVTFHTTAEAIAMEKSCQESNIPGRLIPVPRQISSGCGLSYSAPADQEDAILTHMTAHNLHYESLGTYII